MYKQSTKKSYSQAVIISDRMFNFILGSMLLYGFAMNWYLVSTIPIETIKAIPQWKILVGYIVSAFAGIILYNSSDNPILSFIGYNLVVIPVGVVLQLILSIYSYDPNIVVQSVQLTTVVTFGMIVMGTLFPSFFKGISSMLFISLLMAIIAELVLMFVFKLNLKIMDFIIAIIFCGYIGYDWAKAQESEKTVDSAIDGAANLYLSIINLFIRILSIMGKK